MRIGLLSDSHGNLGAMARAAEMFTGRVDAVIHCGDVTSPQHLEPLL
ncbi:MAG: metallophosphoesterase family protein, partial [bacterium]